MKILLLTGGMGGGHTSPASSVRDALLSLSKSIKHPNDLHVIYESVDVAPFSRNSIDDWRYCLSNTNVASDYIVEPFRQNYAQASTYKKVARLIEEHQPDVVYANHRILAQAASRVCTKNSKIKFVVNTADHGEIHAGRYPAPLRQPLNTNMHLIVPSDTAKKHALNHGVPEEKIKVMGYPVRQSFELDDNNKPAIIANLKQQFGIADNQTVLLISSGLGMWGDQLSNLIKSLEQSFQTKTQSTSTSESNVKKIEKLYTIVICGKNQGLYQHLNWFKERSQLNLSIQGFCDEESMANCMQIADFMAIKAGGATIGECYATQTVPIIYQKLSGVEGANVEHVETFKTGLIALDPQKFIDTIHALLDKEVDITEILANQRQFKTKGSASAIAEELISLAKSGST